MLQIRNQIVKGVTKGLQDILTFICCGGILVHIKFRENLEGFPEFFWQNGISREIRKDSLGNTMGKGWPQERERLPDVCFPANESKRRDLNEH